MKELIKNIEQWAEDRNLIQGSTTQKQFIKLMEEFGELCSGVSKNKVDMVKDSIGDCFVVMVILSKQRGKDEIQQVKDFDELDFLDFATGSIESRLINFLGTLSRLSYELDSGANISPLFTRCVGFLLWLSIDFNLNLQDCFYSAWDEIKDRKGKMIDGVFVKEEDIVGNQQ